MIIRNLGMQDYAPIWEKMKNFTESRTTETLDELWLLEHFPVYTQGQAGRPEHILNPSNIPVIKTDRGGQVTYHGPGQLIAYVLMDLSRNKLGVKSMVCQLEQVLIDLLLSYKIDANRWAGRPGVYVFEKKIASIGLRVKQGCTYHGIALNVTLDMTPFSGINPCGYSALQMTKIADFNESVTLDDVKSNFIQHFLRVFSLEQAKSL